MSETSTTADDEGTFEAEKAAAAAANDCEDLEDVLAHLAGLRARIAASAAKPTRRREPRERAAWSIRAAAARLGCGRDRVRALVRSGAIKVIPWGRSWKVPAAEVERVVREGLPAAPGEGGRRRRLGSRKGAPRPPGPGVGDAIRALPFGRR